MASGKHKLRIYYKKNVKARLNKIRDSSRISPFSGKPMNLLSDEEKKYYLDKGKLMEETLSSMEYDVWKDHEIGYTIIEKYSGEKHLFQCPKCFYHTLTMTENSLKKINLSDYMKPDEYPHCYYCECDFGRIEEKRLLYSKYKQKVIFCDFNSFILGVFEREIHQSKNY